MSGWIHSARCNHSLVQIAGQYCSDCERTVQAETICELRDQLDDRQEEILVKTEVIDELRVVARDVLKRLEGRVWTEATTGARQRLAKLTEEV